MEYQVLMEAGMKMTAFYDIAPFSLVAGRRFSGACCRHHQADRLWNVGLLRDYAAQYPKRLSSCFI